MDKKKDVKIAIGSDHGGFELKAKIADYLKGKNIEVKDFGTFSNESCDYPVFAKEVALEVSKGSFDKGILICGTGIGVSIVANKVKGIRAALCYDTFCAKMSREHNNANILCLGQRVLAEDLALEIVDIWLNSDFEGGRHEKRVNMIED